MKVISRVKFPKNPEISDLYLKSDADIFINFHADDNKIFLHSCSTISFNTYFNSIYEKYYRKYTSITSLYYLLKLEGDFEISAYRENYEVSGKDLIYQQTEKNCQLSDYVKVVLPELKHSEQAGRIYLEITCLSLQGLFTEGLLITEQEKSRDVSLAIISCTFKKEAYIKKTVNTILQDSLLPNKKFKVLIVDNGQTLTESDFSDSRVQLISNRNVGGSGGFTKGLISALEEGVYTHFLFMDDDIELDSEVIYRLFSLYEYAQHDFAVAGSMLDLYKKHILYEAGALYNKELDDQGNIRYSTFAVVPLKQNLDLLKPTSLNFLLREDRIDYGGFWFFSFSKSILEKVGLPLPFFIKIDDMEFGLRINKHFANGVVAFPSIAVWHEPFYAKKPGWDFYYYSRNNLITNSIHASLTYFNAVKVVTRGIIYHLLRFDYNSAQMFVKAFEDYMQGPNILRSNEPEILHSQICKYSKKHVTQTIVPNSISNIDAYGTTKAGKLQKLLSLLTLNGHLLPEFFIKDAIALIQDSVTEQERDSICKAFAKKRVIIFTEKIPYSYQNELDKQAGINILLNWVKSVTVGISRWSKVSAEWKKAAKDLTSIQFWQKYLQPHR